MRCARISPRTQQYDPPGRYPFDDETGEAHIRCPRVLPPQDPHTRCRTGDDRCGTGRTSPDGASRTSDRSEQIPPSRPVTSNRTGPIPYPGGSPPVGAVGRGRTWWRGLFPQGAWTSAETASACCERPSRLPHPHRLWTSQRHFCFAHHPFRHPSETASTASTCVGCRNASDRS